MSDFNRYIIVADVTVYRDGEEHTNEVNASIAAVDISAAIPAFTSLYTEAPFKTSVDFKSIERKNE